MKKTKTLIASVISLALLVALILPSGIATTSDEVYERPTVDVVHDIPYNSPDVDSLPAYLPFSGTIESIVPFYDTDQNPIEGKYFVLLKDGDQIVNFVVDSETYFLNGEASELKEGDRATAFYDASRPAIMIYPPQYPAVVFASGLEEFKIVELDVFDGNLINKSNTLKLLNPDKAEVLDSFGNAFKGDLSGRTLLVVYTAATKSIPAQTNPEKIVVMPEKIIAELFDDLSATIIYADDKRLDGAAARNSDGIIMIPLRITAEALGHTVSWDDASQTVSIDHSISFKLFEDAYKKGDADPISIGKSAELINGLTYIPLPFFREVLGMNNAYVFEGEIHINNSELLK